MAVKKTKPQADLIKDRRFMRRVAHGYEMQIAPGVWLQGAFLAQGQDRFIVDEGKLQSGIEAALLALQSQTDANFAAAALLRLKVACVTVDSEQLRASLAGSAYSLTLLAALDADVLDFDNVAWLQKPGKASAAAGTGPAFLLGSNGDDQLTGAASADTLAGNGGDDRLAGGAGSDIYLFSAGDGRDTIVESFRGAGSAGTADTIRFGAGITPDMLGFKRVGQDLVVSFEGSEDGITIAGWGMDEVNRIERFEFADGTVWDAAALAVHVEASAPVGGEGDDVLTGWNSVNEYLDGGEGNDVLTGASGNDYLDGGNGNDMFDGGSGNDVLNGGAGEDTYVFKRGGGRDTILAYGEEGEGKDTLRFGPGIYASEIVLRRESRGLVFAIAGTGDQVTVRGWGRGDEYELGQVVFADGTVWSVAELQERIAQLPLSSTAGDGDDFVEGWSGFDETLEGLGGDDTLWGGDGNDVLEGGKGADDLFGGGGSDLYLFSRGDGHDRIVNHDDGRSPDTIRFGAGIAADDIVITRVGTGVVLAIKGSNDSVTIDSWVFGPDFQVDRVEFADGSAWDSDALHARIRELPVLGTDGDDVLTGDADDNVLAGGRGNDVVQGSTGSDTYVFERGDGQDTVYEFGDDKDTIRFGVGIGADDLVLSRIGDNLVLAISGSDDRITIPYWGLGDFYRIEQVAFADGTLWDRSTLAAKVAALPLLGTDGDDVLHGDDGANIFDGGAGNDTLQGRSGGDTYLFERGDGHDTIQDWNYTAPATDVIRFGAGIAEDDVVLRRSADGIVFEIAGGNDSITVQWWSHGETYRIERVEFADGTVWEASDLAQRVAAAPVLGTDGDDVLFGDEADNLLDGGAGNDFLQGGGGNDTYLFERGGGQDSISENYFNESDTLRFGAGIGAGDIVLSRSGNDIVFGLAGSDDQVTVKNAGWGDGYRIERVVFEDGTVWEAAALAAMLAAIPYVGTDGDDFLVGDGGANTLIGGAGNDALYGTAGADTYLFERGHGQDTISEYGYDIDTIRFGAGIGVEDVVLSRDGDDLVFAIAGSEDRVTVRNWGYGDYYRVEQVAWADGTTWDAAMLASMVGAIPVIGTDGDDFLVGDGYANSFDGGAGNDTLRGGGGNDAYLFDRGDGQDTIEEDTYGDTDTIRFGAGIKADDIELSRSGTDFVLAISGTGDRITVRNWSSGDRYRVEQVVFADGTVWDAAQLAAMFETAPVRGTDGDDIVHGDWNADIIDGGAGNDTLAGSFGGDTYLFDRGDGHDTIVESDLDWYSTGDDTIRFGAGIAAGDVVLRRSGDDIVFETAAGDSVTVRGWKNGQTSRIEQVVFADGTVWDNAQLAALVAAIPVLGTDGDDFLLGDNDANTFDGGAGNDTLQGGYGSDTYLFERGDGQDSIDEYGYDVDSVRFGAGIRAEDVVLSRSGNDLVLSLAGSDDRVAIRNWASDAYYRIEQVVFADGTVWDAPALAAMFTALPLTGTDGDDVINGDNGANTIAGGAGNDILQGGFGSDTYLFERGDGQDSINEIGYDVDTIRFGAGIAADDIVLSRSGSDLVFSLAGSEDRITVRDYADYGWYRLEQVAFADGTVWDSAALAAILAATPLRGTDGDDYLAGDYGANILAGGAGNDTLSGSYGADTYLFDRGDGQDNIIEGGSDVDTIRFGADIGAADVVVRREGADLVLALRGTDDRITVQYWGYDDHYRIEQVAFADGTVWDAAAIAELAAAPVVGTDGDDYLLGTAEDNVFAGGAGNDTLVGSYGRDTYRFERGDGQDSIEESGYDSDTIRFGAGIAASDVILERRGSDLVFAIAGSDDWVTVRNWAHGDWTRIEQVSFADGTVWDAAALATMFQALPLVGTDANDYLDGDDGANTFDGGAGNDVLAGRYGSDTYLFERGDGHDFINESGYDIDTIRFGAGISASDIVVSEDGTNLVFAIAGTEDRITVEWWAYGDHYRVEQVAFADGSVWDVAALKAQSSEKIVGTAGDDYLTGNDDHNVIYGGAGNDVLQGRFGRDTYVFERGDGQDRISELGYDQDTIRFGAGITAADIAVTREGRDLVIAVAGTEDRITVNDWEYGEFYRIEQVEFADGTVWYADTLMALANQPIVGSDGDDALVGNIDDNVFDGGAGNDILYGMSGADTYLFERGDGQDSIYESGNDIDTLRFGAGIAATDVVVTREGDDVVFTLLGTDDRIAVKNWRYDDTQRIEQVEFADGTAWDATTLQELANVAFVGTRGDDYLVGDADDNVFVGGTGDDTLEGGSGADVYFFERGDGQDTLYEVDMDADTIRFGAGIAVTDVVLAREGAGLVFAIDASRDRITVPDWNFGAHHRIERVEFADGTVWDAAHIATLVAALPIFGTELDDGLIGDENDNVLIGGAGDDLLDGGAGGDTYLFNLGDGRDAVLDAGSEPGRPDIILFGAGIRESDVSVSRYGSELVFTLNGGTDRIEVLNWNVDEAYRIERVEFAEGGVWDAAEIEARIVPLRLEGGDGNDYINGDANSNIFVGGGGTDRLDGSMGDDVYLFGPGDGNDFILDFDYTEGNLDTISFGAGIDPGDVVVTREHDNLVLTVGATGETVTVLGRGAGTDYAIERVEFADGTVWLDADLMARIADEPVLGTGAGDVLTGWIDAPDTLSAQEGIDVLYGQSGADTLDGGADNDLLDGGSGDDILVGGAGSDLLVGGTGNDTVHLEGSDVVLFNRGDGQDAVHAGEGEASLSLGGGIHYADLLFSKSGDDLVLSTGGDEGITFANWYAQGGNGGIANLQLVNGGGVAGSGASIEGFDFGGLVAKFDAARAADPGISAWSLSSSLLEFYLHGDSETALGGRLGHTYGAGYDLSYYSPQFVQAMLATPEFGKSRQEV